MKIHTIFRQYIWLVNTIYEAGKISLEEINAAWRETEMSEGRDIPRTTFNRHRIAIEEMFGLYIECNRNDYKYYIGNAHVLEGNSVQNWMLSTLSVSNILSESASLKDRILIEKIPVAGNLLNQVIEAMKKNCRLEIMYHKYTAYKPKQLTIEPYCVKMFNRRWYILGHFTNGNFGMYSLDRIESLEITDQKFEMPEGFSCEQYFSECFGIVQGDGTVAQPIVVRAYGSERYNLRDLPIHHTQRVIKDGEDYTDFEIIMRPTLDFNAYVLSRTKMLKVLEPEWLQDEIIDMLQDTLSHYMSE